MNHDFFNLAVYDLQQAKKQQLINEQLNHLNHYHLEHCTEYKLLLDSMNYPANADSYEQQPFIAARLFKLKQLKSIPEQQIFKTLSSSGTTSQQVSKIFLDAASAKDQSKVLAKIMQQFIGKQRLPMLLVDKSDLIKDKRAFSARGAGIQGLSFLGRDHTYALNNDMSLNMDAIDGFFKRYADQKIIIFGFTFMLWRPFIRALAAKNKKHQNRVPDQNV